MCVTLLNLQKCRASVCITFLGKSSSPHYQFTNAFLQNSTLTLLSLSHTPPTPHPHPPPTTITHIFIFWHYKIKRQEPGVVCVCYFKLLGNSSNHFQNETQEHINNSLTFSGLSGHYFPDIQMYFSQ